MKNHEHNFEMVRQIIVNEQLGSPKDLRLIIVENSLSDDDKYWVKKAVFDNAQNSTYLNPSELAKELIEAVKIINQA